MFRNIIFSYASNIEFLKTSKSLDDINISLYSKFCKKTKGEIQDIINTQNNIYEKNWNCIVKDEDNVNHEDVFKFYNSLEFPVGSISIEGSDLSLAYNTLPMLIADTNKSRHVFDFGGNDGKLLTAIQIYRVYIVVV